MRIDGDGGGGGGDDVEEVVMMVMEGVKKVEILKLAISRCGVRFTIWLALSSQLI